MGKIKYVDLALLKRIFFKKIIFTQKKLSLPSYWKGTLLSVTDVQKLFSLDNYFII